MNSILLVEDHPDMRSMLSDLLAMDGYHVLPGRNGAEGLHILETAEELPVAIISDLNMPQMDGLSFCATVRHNPLWDSIRLILMSANPNDERLQDARAHGVNALLPKPFTLDMLNRILHG